MKRPWQVWLLFATCVLGVLAGMAWLTREAVLADRMRSLAEGRAKFEQVVSLALWRMDTKLAPIIAEEVIRSPAEYRPTAGGPVSPPTYVLMQFEARPDGQWASPQTATGKSPQLPELEALAKATKFDKLIAQLPDTPLPSIAEVNRNYAANSGATPNANLFANDLQFVEGNQANPPAINAPNGPPQQVAQQQEQRSAQADEELDLQQRNRRYQSAAQQSLMNSLNRGLVDKRNGGKGSPSNGKPMAGVAGEKVGVSKPIWVGTKLLLARRVSNGQTTVVQGCWLDWPALRTDLQNEVRDLLPDPCLTKVRPTTAANANDPKRMLAGLPVQLFTYGIPAVTQISATLRWALWIGWGAALVAVLAAGAMLHGVMKLSERRAAFVSSVTHELRTPLTTFRMYAEMLAKGMVPDANRRQEYFHTLQREAERLTLLVENVLAYARLERGRRPQAQDRVTLAALIDRVGPRLKQRAAQAGMQCDLKLDENAAHQEFTTDQAVVEQILFNLVDNAAKYAREAEDRRIHVEASRSGKSVQLLVRDHGPGIKSGMLSRPMQPFGKSAQQSAETAPGVGLGLSLCRRLARQLGGRLEIVNSADGGAALSLILPCA